MTIINKEDEKPKFSKQNTIVLNARPKSFTRFVEISQTESGIPVIREVIIIQTEPSKSQLVSIFVTFLIYGIIIHVFIALWEKYHPKSCKGILRLILFTLPLILIAFMREYFFLFIYLVFIITVAKVYFLIRQKPIRRKTPRYVYKTFKILTRICYASTILTVTLLFVGFFAKIQTLMGFALSNMFYALYFGLLTREMSEFLCSQMAINIGYYTVDGVPQKKIGESTCAICDEQLNKSIISLNCKHSFHEECLKGWIFTGKKNFCPCCKENVDYGKIMTDKWERSENMYSGMLDGMRKGIIFLSMLCVFALFLKLFN